MKRKTQGPLNPLPDGTTDAEWGKMIGFGCSPHNLLKADVPYKDFFLMNVWSKTGDAAKKLPSPTLKFPPNYEVPHGAYVKFATIPYGLHSISTYYRYLAARDKAPRGKWNRPTLLRLVKGISGAMQHY
jgi:hypothetical protein